MILIRYFLIGLIVYLLARAFLKFGQENKPHSNPDTSENRKVSKDVGEYVDYEEISEDDF